ncbi:hypothetical protein C8R45DRAFT_1103870 [Mycena sanguinolenta]|nr:hypothetical protein C8R45DRAFT_1103870 [Mycena sanguinolenta]
MSTSGRPPRRVDELLDVEAEEDDDADSDEAPNVDMDRYESDFIDDSAAMDDGASSDKDESIPWEATPPREIVVSSDSEEDNSGDDYTAKPSKRKSSGARAQLNTKGYQGSDARRAKGIPSSAVVRGAVRDERQARLEVKASKPLFTSVEMTDDEVAAFERFKAAEEKKKKKTTKPPPKKTGKAASTKTTAPATRASATKNAKGSVKDKRKRADSDVDERPAMPVPDLTNFNAKRDSDSAHNTSLPGPDLSRFNAKRSEAQSSTAKDSVEEEVIHETKNTRKPRPSPAVCEVMDVKVQDSMLKSIYETGLPKLERGSLISWNSNTGPGMFMPSDLGALNPKINIGLLWSFLNFICKDRYVNLARIAPEKLEAAYLIIGNEDKRWTLSMNGSTAFCISVAIVTDSSLTDIRSESGKSGPNIPMSKLLKARLATQEYDRNTANTCMVFGHKALHAQISEDSITMSTKSTTADKIKKGNKNWTAGGIQSASTSYKSGPFNADTLPHTTEIPVYDGRHGPLDAYDCVGNLSTLPRYTEHGGEIRDNSCAVVCYTVTQYHYRGKEGKPDEECVNFNIQWAIVLGEPE